MLKDIHPKLPMRDKAVTIAYYVNGLGFKLLADYGDYLMLAKDRVEVHFFLYIALDPKENYGQVYLRTDDIESLYHSLQLNGVSIHPHGSLVSKPWGQKEFSLLDPDHNLLTFGQAV